MRVPVRGRWLIAIIVAIGAIISYFNMSESNPITGESQRVAITPEQEIALGLQAAPQMIDQYGGLSSNMEARRLVDEVGQELVERSEARNGPYQFEFHLLGDPNTVNAFALPGGQIFITEGLLAQLETKDQLAGVLGHEIGHVIERHSAQQMAKAKLTQGLTGAAVIASYDPNDPSTYRNAAFAQLVGQLVNMKYGRDDELESDTWGVHILDNSGYDPEAMIGVMQILAKAGGGSRQPEFFSTHPNPENRIEHIREAIEQERAQ